MRKGTGEQDGGLSDYRVCWSPRVQQVASAAPPGCRCVTCPCLTMVFMPAGPKASDWPAEPDGPCRELVDLSKSQGPTWKNDMSFLCCGKH